MHIAQVVLPLSLWREVFTMLHAVPTDGHFGVLRRDSIGLIIKEIQWCRECPACQVHNPITKHPKAQMRQYFVGAPMKRVAIDIFGPLPRTKAGQIYILIVCDYFTRWTEGFPFTNIEASTVAQTFVFQFICRFGVPRQVHTDQGTQFESDLFKEICKL